MEEAFHYFFFLKSNIMFLLVESFVLFTFASTHGFCSNQSVFPFAFKYSIQGREDKPQNTTFSCSEFSCSSWPASLWHRSTRYLTYDRGRRRRRPFSEPTAKSTRPLGFTWHYFPQMLFPFLITSLCSSARRWD